MESENTIYGVDPRYVLMGRKTLADVSKKIILIGASTVRAGFRPNKLASQFPDYDIHNLSIGASNFTEIKQVMELAHETISKKVRHETIYVIGIWYGGLIDDKLHWENGKTDLDIEKLRFGLYQTVEGEIKPKYSPIITSILIKILRPFLFIDRLIYVNINTLIIELKYKGMLLLKGARFEGAAPFNKEVDLNLVVVDEVEKRRALKYWADHLGNNVNDSSLFVEQLTVLNDMVKFLKENGGKLVLVDLPIPKWHADRSLYFHEYQKRKLPYIKKITSHDQVSYINLQNELNDNNDYYDSAHPKPMVIEKWNKKLSFKLKKTLKDKGNI